MKAVRQQSISVPSLRSTMLVAVLGGGLAFATAAALGLGQQRVQLAVKPVMLPAVVQSTPPVAPPTVAAVVETKTATAVDFSDSGELIRGERMVLALETEELTNFEAEAQERISAGEVEAAFVALRKHLWRNAPTSEHLLTLARLGRQLEQHALVEQALLDASALDPRNPDVQVELARVLFETGDYEHARFAARAAIRLDPSDATAWNIAGRIAMKQSEWHRAETALRRAVELDPTNALMHNNLGLLYIYQHRAKDAIDSLEAAVELSEELPHDFVLNNLGLAYELASDLEEAKVAFEQALAMRPTYVRARLNLERIERKLGDLDEERSFQTARSEDTTIEVTAEDDTATAEQ